MKPLIKIGNRPKYYGRFLEMFRIEDSHFIKCVLALSQ